MSTVMNQNAILSPLESSDDSAPRPPADWHPTTMERIGSIYGGLSAKTKGDFGHGTGRYVPFLNVLENVTLDLDSLDAVDVKPSEAQNLVRVGDILFNGTSETPSDLALGAVVDDDVSNLYLNSFCFGFRINDPSHYDAMFLAYFFRGSKGRELMSALAQGATRYNMSKRKFLQLGLELPLYTEQRAIAEALSEVDGQLGALEALIAKKRAMKQAAMQELLTGKTRLPGYTPSGFRATGIGAIPADWLLVPLVGLVDPARGIRYGIVQPGSYDPNGRYMVRGQDYSEAKGWADPSGVFRVSPGVEERYRNARVREGDLIMTIVGYCGHVEMVPSWLDGANLTQTTARIAIKSDIATAAYCKYVLQSQIGKKQVAAYVKGAAQPGLNCGDVEKFLLGLPSPEEQVAIATVLSDMDAEITALERRRDKTRAIKQGMMQHLLTGRVRLVESAPVEAGA